MKIYWELFSVFMRIGAFTFGGGYAMLPLIQKEIVDKKHWATEEEIMDYYAVAQCTRQRLSAFMRKESLVLLSQRWVLLRQASSLFC